MPDRKVLAQPDAKLTARAARDTRSAAVTGLSAPTGLTIDVTSPAARPIPRIRRMAWLNAVPHLARPRIAIHYVDADV